MATLHTAAHVSTCQLERAELAGKGSDTKHKLNCALSPPAWKQSRRLVSISVFLSHLLLPNDAMAGSFLDKYVKRASTLLMRLPYCFLDNAHKKKLDPLDAYVPPVILAQLQIQDVERNLEAEKPEYETCRSLLRSGPASSLRVNIRAVAQYASDAGNGNSAFEQVDRCLSSLEDLDYLLLRALRKDQDASVETMKAKLATALNALDSLLQTVPSQVLDRGKAMVEVYRSSSSQQDAEPNDTSPQVSPDIQQLQSIL